MKAERKISTLFRDFIDREYDRLIHYVKVRFNEAYYNEYAEDIVQDVALNIYSKLDVNSSIENIAGYFYRSLQNRIIDLKRKKVVQTSLENYTYKESGENIALQRHAEKNADDPTPDEIAELDLNLSKAIEQLPDEYKNILLAIEFEGVTYKELSEKTGIPVGTLLSRKHRAIAQLTKIMNDEYFNF
ncbi:MAG: RNA polymerase sigma factor [Bacteroidales bacterium]|nr:RNA polymerase sigma factor [Bacteroidales bacterium]